MRGGLILIGAAEGPTTLFERLYMGYSFSPLGSVIGAVWSFVIFKTPAENHGRLSPE